MDKIKIFLIDDHTLFRQGVKRLLESEEDLAVVGEASEGRSGLKLIQKLMPDIVVLDISMPVMGGLEVMERIERISASIKTIILSMYKNHNYVYRALSLGAKGYMLKEATAIELVNAIRIVISGGVYTSPSVSQVLVNGFVLGEKEKKEKRVAEARLLTKREKEVLKLLAEGRKIKEVAELLSISQKTVEVHKSHVMGKLNARSNADLVKFAIKCKLIRLEC